jgi:hypothetical protein
MNYYIKKYIEIKEYLFDFILCCFDCIKKHKTRVYYYNLDDFNMDNNFCKVKVTTSENEYYQEPVIIPRHNEDTKIIIQDVIDSIVSTTENIENI